MKKLLFILTLFCLLINDVHAYESESCFKVAVYPEYSEQLKNITIPTLFYNEQDVLVKIINATYKEGYFTETAYVSSFCTKTIFNQKGKYRAVINGTNLSVIKGNLNKSFFVLPTFPFDCNIDETFTISGIDKMKILIKADLYNPFNFSIPISLKNEDNSEYFRIYIRQGSVMIETNNLNETMIEPHASFSIVSEKKGYKRLEHYGEDISFIYTPSIDDPYLIPGVCPEAKQITYNLVIPKEYFFINKLSVKELGLNSEDSQDDDNLIYRWVKEDNNKNPIFIKYRYKFDWYVLAKGILLILAGIAIDRIITWIWKKRKARKSKKKSEGRSS